MRCNSVARWFFCSLLAAIGMPALCQAVELGQRAKTPALPEPPPFPCSAGEADRFFREASQFVAKHGDSPHAPSVQHTIVMLAQLARRDDLVREQQYLLVMKYPQSLPSAHVVATMTNPAAFRKLLRLHSERSKTAPVSKAYAAAFCSAAELGAHRWGAAKFFDDDSFLLEFTVAAALAGRPDVDRFVALARQQTKSQTRRVVDVFFDPGRSNVEKLIAIDALDAGPAVAVCHEALWQQLSDAERNELEPTLAHTVYLCERGEIEAAARLLQRSPHDEPHLHFLRVWCHTAVGDAESAKAALVVLAKNHASSPWTARTTELARRVGDLKENFAAHGALWKAAIAQWHNQPLGIEATLKLGPIGDRYRYEAYLTLCPADRLFDIRLHDGGRPILAYLADAENTRVYSDDDERTLELPSRNSFPVFRWTVAAADDRPFPRRGMGIHFDMADAGTYANSVQSLLAIPLLGSADEVSTTLGDVVQSGYLPCTVSLKDGRTTGAWVRPNPRTGDLQQWEFDFDDESRLAAVRSASFRVENIRYRSNDAWRADSPAWPDSTVQRLDSFDATALAKIMGALMRVSQTLGDGETPQETAAGRLKEAQ